jgi:hypothetical protein
MIKNSSITPTELDEIRREIKIEIKSLLASQIKHGLTEHEFKRDYKYNYGKDVPYLDLGFQNIYEMMRSMPDVCYATKHHIGKMWVYHPVIDENIKNLASLVRGQKTDKSDAKREQMRSQFKSNTNPRFYNQSSYYREQHPASYTNVKILPTDIQVRIKNVLIASLNNKVNLNEIEKLYQLKYQTHLNYLQFGYKSLRHLIESLKHIVRIESQNGIENNDSDIVCLINSSNDLNQITISNNENEQKSNDHIIEKNAINSETIIKQMTYEEEIKENIRNIIKSEKSIVLSDICSLYLKHTKKELDYEKLGLKDVCDLSQSLKNLKIPNIRIEYDKKSYEKVLIYDERCKQTEIVSTFSDDDDDDEKNIEELKSFIENTFKIQKKASFSEFLVNFERRNGWKLNYKDYGFKNNDQLILELTRRGFIKSEIGENKLAIFSYEQNKQANHDEKPRLSLNIDYNKINVIISNHIKNFK